MPSLFLSTLCQWNHLVTLRHGVLLRYGVITICNHFLTCLLFQIGPSLTAGSKKTKTLSAFLCISFKAWCTVFLKKNLKYDLPSSMECSKNSPTHYKQSNCLKNKLDRVIMFIIGYDPSCSASHFLEVLEPVANRLPRKLPVPELVRTSHPHAMAHGIHSSKQGFES